jgi:hypothetical protein
MANGSFSKSGMFFIGLFCGILLAAAAGLMGAKYLINNPQIVMTKVASAGIGKMIQRTAESAPREYIGQKQDEIAVTAQAFAKAYSEQKVTPEDIQAIGIKVMSVLADQKISQNEIDDVLRMMQRYAGVTAAVTPVPAAPAVPEANPVK